MSFKLCSRQKLGSEPQPSSGRRMSIPHDNSIGDRQYSNSGNPTLSHYLTTTSGKWSLAKQYYDWTVKILSHESTDLEYLSIVTGCIIARNILFAAIVPPSISKSRHGLLLLTIKANGRKGRGGSINDTSRMMPGPTCRSLTVQRLRLQRCMQHVESYL